jgi:hypothetical protein
LYWQPSIVIYTMWPMADNHRPLRLPTWLWLQYAKVVGNAGRTDDLKVFMDWRIDHRGLELGDDVAAPYDFLTTLRVELERWKMFRDSVDDRECSAELRRYIWWRVQHPDTPLPGRRLGPLRRERRDALV